MLEFCFFLMIYDDDIDFCLFVCLIRKQEFEMPFVCFFDDFFFLLLFCFQEVEIIN